ncbi:MAG: hypothetical protein PHD48_09615 [Alphaproteobacteria bacterium]|nr:hypothetical protein [Alphaproteobacteria bacterium]
MSSLSISRDYAEQFIQDNASFAYSASVLVFPYKGTGVTPAASGDDVIDQRMHAPLSSHETNALRDMIKYRAKNLEQEIWVTTQTFFATMGVEEMDDLCRRDFVRAVEYLVRLDLGSN